MNEDRDLNRLLDAWFADGPVQVADRVVDDTASRIARQRQTPRVAPPLLEVPHDVHSDQARGDRRRAARRPRRRRRLHGRRCRPRRPRRRPQRQAPSPMPLPGWLAGARDLSRAALPRQSLDVDGHRPGRVVRLRRLGRVGAGMPDERRTVVGHGPTKIGVPADSCSAGRDTAAANRWTTSSRRSRHATTGSCRNRSTSTVSGYHGKRDRSRAARDVAVCGGDRDDYIVTRRGRRAGWLRPGPVQPVHLWALDVDGTPLTHHAIDASPASPAERDDPVRRDRRLERHHALIRQAATTARDLA